MLLRARNTLIAALLGAALAIAGCGGSSNDEKTGNSSGAAPTQYTGNPVTAVGTNTATSTAPGVATTSTAQPKHSKGGPKSAHLGSKGAPDNAITTKTTPGG